MPKLTGPAVVLTVRGTTFTFTARALDGFPEAPAFLDYLLARGSTSHTIAVYYVKLVARLRRMGRLNHPEVLVHRVEKTAATAYWKWINTGYDDRVLLVTRSFRDAELNAGIRWIRRGQLVPPYPGKKLLRRLIPTPATMGMVAQDPCDVWTLHIPRNGHTPAHADPCVDCAYLKVSDAQLGLIADAFEKAWGHRDLEAVPADCYLFGQPPIVDLIEHNFKATSRVVAVLPNGALTAACEQIAAASVSRSAPTFLDRIKGDDVSDVALNFDSIGPDYLDTVLVAVREAGLRWYARPKFEPEKKPVTAWPVGGLDLPGAPQAIGPTATWDDIVATSAPVPAIPTHVPAEVTSEIVPMPGMTLVPPPPPPQAPDAPFVPTDWSKHNHVPNTRLVRCTVHCTDHSVEPDAVPCAPEAWVDIRV